MNKEAVQLFFEEFIGEKALQFTPLAQSGSSRQNFVGKNSTNTFVITSNTNTEENESFFYFSSVFSRLELNTPNILRISSDRTTYIQEFLGPHTLSEIIEKERLSEKVENLVRQTLQKLFVLQTKTFGNVDYTKTFEYESYDELPITHDLFYFKSFVADVLEIPYHKTSLLREFKNLAARIENLEPKGLMIRDFQSRNIIVNEQEEVSFIDYQSAMKGPLLYDVISFLYQAKANFPDSFREKMLGEYFSLWKDEDKTVAFQESIKPLQFIRYLQVLGAYGFRGLVQKKPHFMQSLHLGIDNLGKLATSWPEMETYPELKKIIHALHSEEIKDKIRNILKI